jgi:hypothetical protein
MKQQRRSSGFTGLEMDVQAVFGECVRHRFAGP